MASRNEDLPTIALAVGDPSGISPELTAKLLADDAVRAAMRCVVIGDRRVLALGERHAGLTWTSPSSTMKARLWRRRPTCSGTRSISIPKGLRSATSRAPAVPRRCIIFELLSDLAQSGRVAAVCFTPFNKAAMRLAHPSYEDEIVFLTEELAFDGKASEFNILDGLWNARVTSHVPLKAVAGHITKDLILENLELTQQSLMAAGVAQPRIGVAALNPHAGDGGNFGSEEIDIIEPAVKEGQARGLGCSGPFPSDTVFVRAQKGQFDAVLTMYHDQGQIAMKLIGFEAGVTLLGGFAFPICTPAHGTAYDIAGKGVANVGASRNALLLAAKMGALGRGQAQAPNNRQDATRAVS